MMDCVSKTKIQAVAERVDRLRHEIIADTTNSRTVSVAAELKLIAELLREIAEPAELISSGGSMD